MDLRLYLAQFKPTERAVLRAQLASLLEVSRQTVYNWEARRHRPRTRHFRTLQSWSSHQITWEALYDQ